MDAVVSMQSHDGILKHFLFILKNVILEFKLGGRGGVSENTSSNQTWEDCMRAIQFSSRVE
jgi:hypothetical protein